MEDTNYKSSSSPFFSSQKKGLNGGLESIIDGTRSSIRKATKKATNYIAPLVVAASIYLGGCGDEFSNPVRVMDQIEDRTVQTTGDIRKDENIQKIILSDNYIDENEKPNTEVGNFSTEEEGNFQYFLKDDKSKENFYIKDDTLFARNTLDYEKANTYDIKVGRKNLQTGETTYKDFPISVNDLPEPGDITLSNNTIMENNKTDAMIGKIKNISSENTTYKITSDKAKENFQIDKDKNLRARKSFNHEEKDKYTIPIQETNTETKKKTAKNLEVIIGDVNENPTGIRFQDPITNHPIQVLEIAENNGSNHSIAKITPMDEDEDETHKISLNGRNKRYFGINREGELVAKIILNYEKVGDAIMRDDIMIEIEDKAGNTYEGAYKVKVLDVNDPPTDITLLPEEESYLVRIADEDKEDSIAVDILQGEDYFKLEGDKIVRKILHYQDEVLELQATDKAGETCTKSFIIPGLELPPQPEPEPEPPSEPTPSDPDPEPPSEPDPPSNPDPEPPSEPDPPQPPPDDDYEPPDGGGEF